MLERAKWSELEGLHDVTKSQLAKAASEIDLELPMA
jgi:hypothetical protein